VLVVPVAKEICLPCTGCNVTLPSLMVPCFLGFNKFLTWLLVVGYRDVATADKNDIMWLMASMGLSPCLNTEIVRPESSWGNSACCGCRLTAEDIPIVGWIVVENKRIIETDKVNHIVETNIVKLVVEIESFGMSCDDFDKETGSSNGLQPKQANLSCVHALSELHLHEIMLSRESI
nr:hypothetical protein [Tanacetum cinerariifolium]